jgi:molybdopterin converting factor small subunit
MKIRLLAFATAAETLGTAVLDWPLAEGATVADLARELAERHPALGPRLSRFAWAVDGELCRPDRALTEGAEVALLPPVSGG